MRASSIPQHYQTMIFSFGLVWFREIDRPHPQKRNFLNTSVNKMHPKFKVFVAVCILISCLFDPGKINKSINFARSHTCHTRVTLDSHLTLCQQHLSRSFPSVSFYCRIKKYLSQADTERIVHAFVLSKLDYCNGLLYGIPSRATEKF